MFEFFSSFVIRAARANSRDPRNTLTPVLANIKARRTPILPVPRMPILFIAHSPIYLPRGPFLATYRKDHGTRRHTRPAVVARSRLPCMRSCEEVVSPLGPLPQIRSKRRIASAQLSQ